MTDADRIDAPALDPRSAEIYLSAHGWEPKKRTSRYSTWLRLIDHRPAHLFLPLDPQPVDYSERLLEFVRKLAAAENRAEDIVATNLRYASADLVRLRLSGAGIGRGEVSLAAGTHLFECAQGVMTAAACSAVVERPQYGPKRPRQATEYIEGVRLGQTEVGS